MYITLCIWCLWRVEKEQNSLRWKDTKWYDNKIEKGRWNQSGYNIFIRLEQRAILPNCWFCLVHGRCSPSPSLLHKYGKAWKRHSSPATEACHARIDLFPFLLRENVDVTGFQFRCQAWSSQNVSFLAGSFSLNQPHRKPQMLDQHLRFAMWLSWFFGNVFTKHMVLVWCGLRQVVRLPIPTKDCSLTSSVAKNERERKVYHAFPNYKRKVCKCDKILPGWHQFYPTLGYPWIYLGWDMFFTRWCRESGAVGCSTGDGYGLWRNQSKAGMYLEQGRFNLLMCRV